VGQHGAVAPAANIYSDLLFLNCITFLSDIIEFFLLLPQGGEFLKTVLLSGGEGGRNTTVAQVLFAVRDKLRFTIPPNRFYSFKGSMGVFHFIRYGHRSLLLLIDPPSRI